MVNIERSFGSCGGCVVVVGAGVDGTKLPTVDGGVVSVVAVVSVVGVVSGATVAGGSIVVDEGSVVTSTRL
jgi:hypothetical protein